MADAPKEPTQAEKDAEEAAAKGKFQEWFTESMTTWQTEQDRKRAEEEKKNPPRNESGNGSQAAPRRQNGLQKLLNL